MVEASNAEMLASQQNKRAKDAFLISMAQSPDVNKKKAFEMRAELAGFTQDQIDQLLDTSSFGTASLLADADADLEEVLNGEKTVPNRSANNAYKQYFVDYMNNHSKELSDAEFSKLASYVESLADIIIKNEARALQNEPTQAMLKQSIMQSAQPPQPGMPPQGQPMGQSMGQPQPQQGLPTGFPPK
jgi:succinate dehydrogenase flavin-adding protein (antitoxin of CptAB toxin-antitoxin module)